MGKLKLEVGKYYRTRDGRKVGPLVENTFGSFTEDYPYRDQVTALTFMANGAYHEFGISEYDIIAEWTDTPEVGAPDQAMIDRVQYATKGPVITETVKRIVPGVFGKVEVELDGLDDRPIVQMSDYMSRDDLTEAIATLTAIRDAL